MLRSRHFLLAFCLFAASVQQNAFSFLRAAEPPPEAAAPAAMPAAMPAAPESDEETDRFYDRRNPDHGRLQKADEVRGGLPADKRGAIDWMTALRSGAITPRSDLDGSRGPAVLDLDVILRNTKEMPYVKFPHNSHTEWLACSNCHDQLFVPRAGANPITMEKIFRGEYCGACHGRVAFITHYSCERCHSVPHGETRAWW